MKFIDLFSGIGGFRLPLEELGHECAWSCEVDKYANRVYRYHWRDAEPAADVRTVDTRDIPDHDLLCGGFPCQSFSIAGKRKGFQDTRGTLFYEICRILGDKKPKMVLLENVQGLFSDDSYRSFKTILESLRELGYVGRYQMLNTIHWLPQNRPRVFIVGYLGGRGRREVFPLGQDGGISPEADGGEQEGGAGVPSENSPALRATYNKGYQTRGPLIASTIDARYGALRNAGETYIKAPDHARALTAGAHSTGLHSDMTLIEVTNSESDANRIYDPKGVARALKSEGGGLGAKTGLYVVEDKKSVKSALIQSRGLETRADDKSHCIKGGGGGTSKNHVFIQNRPHGWNKGLKKKVPNLRASATQHNELLVLGTRIRRLTPIECEKLQGFPRDWTKWGVDEKGEKVLISDSQRYKMIGNAVSIPVVQAIGRRLA